MKHFIIIVPVREDAWLTYLLILLGETWGKFSNISF